MSRDKACKNKGDLKLDFDLSSLFESEEVLVKSYPEMQKSCEEFQGKYIEKISSLNEIEFENAIIEYENILEQINKAGAFAFLNFAVDNQKYGKLYADCELRCKELYSKVIFFEIEFCNLDEVQIDKFIAHSKKYGYYLQSLKDSKKYKLSLKEEQIMLNLSPVGANAFMRLFDESLSNLKFKGVLDKKEINEEEILALMHNKKRKIRKKAQEIFTEKLQENSHLLTYILNIVRKNLSIVKNLRGYEKPESFRHIDNKATQKSVDCLIDCANKNMNIVHQYYECKSKLLGIRLKDYDRYAPLLLVKKSISINFKQGLDLVLDSFKKFDNTFYDIAKRAIDEGWISSHPSPTKRGGAFSYGGVPSSHPFVLLNHTGNRRDVFTIAHEFGHMIHQELSKSQGILNMDTPLTTAETASVFAEMLLFDNMRDSLNKKELIEIMGGKIEDIFSTLFRQIVMTNFERRVHGLDGEQSTEIFNQIWIEENQKMFGKSVKLTQNYSSWWSYIPHFIHSPFYCYAYSYGQLLVLALFGIYKKSEDRSEFTKKYIDFLSSGGSRSPRDLVLDFGFDIENPDFWEVGMDYIKDMLEEFKSLIK